MQIPGSFDIKMIKDSHSSTLTPYFDSSEATFTSIRIFAVTFFFNAGRELPFSGEDRILTPSPKVATYDLQPEMSAVKITENAFFKPFHFP